MLFGVLPEGLNLVLPGATWCDTWGNNCLRYPCQEARVLGKINSGSLVFWVIGFFELSFQPGKLGFLGQVLFLDYLRLDFLWSDCFSSEIISTW